MKKIILAVTGSSGAPIGLRLLEALLEREDVEVSFVMSDAARLTAKLEAGIDFGKMHADLESALAENFGPSGRLKVYDASDMAARISSGSHKTDAMIVAPCSMSTLGQVAHGITQNLIHRAASVMLKEKRPLVLVPRESPLSPIHLEAMLTLSRAGVHIVPATLAFYTRPEKISDLVDFTCARVLDLLNIGHNLSKRWQGNIENHVVHTRIQNYLG
jgi:4-hydroxy-3-polyprenylbenzoate decarboxylase